MVSHGKGDGLRQAGQARRRSYLSARFSRSSAPLCCHLFLAAWFSGPWWHHLFV